MACRSKNESEVRQMKKIFLHATEITEAQANNALQCLIDNGIDEDDAYEILTALGYILLDEELFPDEDGTVNIQQPRKFFDTETREIITEDVLAATLEELKECDPDTYGDITLGQYINNCLTINNGTLEEI
jgi:hypothetical protein